MVQATDQEAEQLPLDGGEATAAPPSPPQESPSVGVDDIRRGLGEDSSDRTSATADADKPESGGKPAETRTYTQEEYEQAREQDRRTLQGIYDRNFQAAQEQLAQQSYQEMQREEIRADLYRIREEDPEEWTQITKDPQVLQFLGDIARQETQSLRGQLEQQIGGKYYADGLTEGTVNVVKAANTQPEFKDWTRQTFEEKGLWPQNQSGQIEDYQKWLGSIIDYAAKERAQKMARPMAEEIAKASNRQFISGVNGTLGNSIPPTGVGSPGGIGPGDGASGLDLIRAGLEGKR